MIKKPGLLLHLNVWISVVGLTHIRILGHHLRALVYIHRVLLMLALFLVSIDFPVEILQLPLLLYIL